MGIECRRRCVVKRHRAENTYLPALRFGQLRYALVGIFPVGIHADDAGLGLETGGDGRGRRGRIRNDARQIVSGVHSLGREGVHHQFGLFRPFQPFLMSQIKLRRITLRDSHPVTDEQEHILGFLRIRLGCGLGPTDSVADRTPQADTHQRCKRTSFSLKHAFSF